MALIGSGSGLLHSTSLPRVRAFERQSWWTDSSTAPMVRIARRVQAARPAPVDPGYASPTSSNQQVSANSATAPADIPTRFTQPLVLDWSSNDKAAHNENIEIYTNAEDVEVFLNDKSLGTQKLHSDASPITYQVPFEPGILKAIGRISGRIVATDELHTAGKPAHLVLSTGLDAAHLTSKPQVAIAPVITPNWDDVVYVTATLVDAANNAIPDSATTVRFAVEGAARIVGVDNGNMLDHGSFQATDRKLYDGNAIAILYSTSASGSITLTACVDGVPPAKLTLTSQSASASKIQRSF